MIEWLSASVLYNLGKDLIGAFRRNKRRLGSAEVLALRQKWKPLFEEEIWKTFSEKLRRDAIIRDVKRIDSYPDIDSKTKGISPWYRVGLMGTYHKGILVGLRWGELTKHDDKAGWRYTDYGAGETGDIRVVLIGRVPFENIEAVDWDGDEYYYFPHIYCHFDAKNKEPYEALVFCEEKRNPGSLPFFIEIAPYDQVRHLSKKLGISSSFQDENGIEGLCFISRLGGLCSTQKPNDVRPKATGQHVVPGPLLTGCDILPPF